MKRKRSVLAFIVTTAMLAAELQPLAAPLSAHAAEQGYVSEVLSVEQDDASKNAVPESAVSENTVSENAVPESTVSENVVSENAVSENSVSENSVSENEPKVDEGGVERLKANPDSDFEWDASDSGMITKYIGSSTDVVIPARAQRIGSAAFSTMYPLSGTPTGCVLINSLRFEEGCVWIQGSAFEGQTELKTVELPRSLATIGRHAFYDCDIRKITIPANVSRLGYRAFTGNQNLSELRIESPILKYDPLSGNDMLDPAGAFDGCSLSVITFGDVDTIPDHLFWGNCFCSDCVLEIPEGIKHIKLGAFNQASGLKEIRLPDSLIDIEDGAFGYCSNLVSVVLPVSLNSIGKSAFYGCTAIETATYKGTKEQWDSVSVGEGNDALLSHLVFAFGEDPQPGIVWDMNKDAWGFGNYKLAPKDGGLLGTSYPKMNMDPDDYKAFKKAVKEKYGTAFKRNSAAECGTARIWFEYDGLSGIGTRDYNTKYVIPCRSVAGHCVGFSLSSIANKMGYRDIATDLHSVPKRSVSDNAVGESTISCFALMQFTPEYQNCKKSFMEIDKDKRIDYAIEAAKNVGENGPAAMAYTADGWGSHMVVICGYREVSESDKVLFLVGHDYDHVVEIYDSNRIDSDGTELTTQEKLNMYVNTGTGEWYIPGYAHISSSLTGETTTETDDDGKQVKKCKRNDGEDVTVYTNAAVQVVSSDPDFIYPIHYDGNLNLDKPATTKSTAEEELAEMPDILTVGNANALNISYGDWSAVISREGMEDDGRGISFYDEGATGEGVPLNVYLPDVSTHEASFASADGESTALGVMMLAGNYYVDADAEKLESLHISDDGSFTVSGNDGEYSISLTADVLPEDSYCTYKVAGNNKGTFRVSMNKDGGVTISGEAIDGITVTAEDLDGETKTVVVDDKDGDGTAVIKGDKKEESGVIELDGEPVESIADAFKKMTDVNKDYTLALGCDVTGVKNLTVPKKAKSLTIEGNGHSIEITGAKLASNVPLTLKDVKIKAVTKKSAPANFSLQAKKELSIEDLQVEAKAFTLKATGTLTIDGDLAAKTISAKDMSIQGAITATNLKANAVTLNGSISANVLNCTELELCEGSVLVASPESRITVKKAMKGSGGQIELQKGFKRPISLNGTVDGTVIFTGEKVADGTQILKSSPKKIKAEDLAKCFDVSGVTDNAVDTKLVYFSGSKACIYGESIRYHEKNYALWKDVVAAMNADQKAAKKEKKTCSFELELLENVNINGGFKLPAKGYERLTVNGNGHTICFTGNIKLTGNTTFNELVLKKVNKKGEEQVLKISTGKFDFKQ